MHDSHGGVHRICMIPMHDSHGVEHGVHGIYA